MWASAAVAAMLCGGLDADDRSPVFHRGRLLVAPRGRTPASHDHGATPRGSPGPGAGAGAVPGGAWYWAAGTLASSGPRFLAQGREFSSEDLITICRNFDAKGIWYRSEERKIQVAADQYDQAVALLAKLDVGPRPSTSSARPPIRSRTSSTRLTRRSSRAGFARRRSSSGSSTASMVSSGRSCRSSAPGPAS